MELHWSSLKEARAFLALADEQLVDAGRTLAAASAAYDNARVVRQDAAAALTSTKAAFDAAFNAPDCPA